MPAARKKAKSASKVALAGISGPWSCVHHPDRSEIEAYVEATGDWQTIAEVRQTASINAKSTANFIVRASNDFEKNREIAAELIAALELCLECENLSWEAEHDAEIALARAKLKV